jgi:hypothetical protein
MRVGIKDGVRVLVHDKFARWHGKHADAVAEGIVKYMMAKWDNPVLELQEIWDVIGKDGMLGQIVATIRVAEDWSKEVLIGMDGEVELFETDRYERGLN